MPDPEEMEGWLANPITRELLDKLEGIERDLQAKYMNLSIENVPRHQGREIQIHWLIQFIRSGFQE